MVVKCCAVILALLAFSCSYSDYAYLEASSLTVDPCTDKGPRTFAPFRLDADLLRWFAAEGVGTIEARRGFRLATHSDALIFQFTDIESTMKAFEEDPSREFEVGQNGMRVSLFLGSTCPRSFQPIIGVGSIRLTSFEPWKGGRIEGQGTVDLYDARAEARNAGSGLLVSQAAIGFSMKIRSGPPHEDFTLWP